jgi:hypothetical protein
MFFFKYTGFPLLFVGLSAGVKIDAYGTDQW